MPCDCSIPYLSWCSVVGSGAEVDVSRETEWVASRRASIVAMSQGSTAWMPEHRNGRSCGKRSGDVRRCDYGVLRSTVPVRIRLFVDESDGGMLRRCVTATMSAITPRSGARAGRRSHSGKRGTLPLDPIGAGCSGGTSVRGQQTQRPASWTSLALSTDCGSGDVFTSAHGPAFARPPADVIVTRWCNAAHVREETGVRCSRS